MALDLLKRSEKGSALSATDYDANLTAIEGIVTTERVQDHGALGDAVQSRASNQVSISSSVAPADGATLTINGVTLTFRTTATLSTDVQIAVGTWSATLAKDTNRNLNDAILALGGQHAINRHLELRARERNIVFFRRGASGQQATAAISVTDTAGSVTVAAAGWTGGAICTAASTTVTVPGGAFVAGDVGKRIAIMRAGPLGNTVGDTDAGMTHWTTIASVVSGTEITIDDAAVSSCAEAEFIYGTLDQTAIQAAVDALAATGKGGVVDLEPGKTYLVFNIALGKGVPIILRGNGATLMQAPGVLRDHGANRSILDCGMSFLLYYDRIQYGLFPKITIRDLRVDGASWFQNNEQYAGVGLRNRYVGRFNYEQNHGIKCYGPEDDGVDNDLGFWQPVSIENVSLSNICGDGISFGKNSIVAARSIRGFNCFRGTLTCLSQCNSLYLSDFQSDDDDRMGDYFNDDTFNTGAQSGIYFETEDEQPTILPQGYPYQQNVVIDGALLKQGRLTIATLGNSANEVVPGATTYSITLRNIIVPRENNIRTQCVFSSSGPGQINIYDSIFHGGRDDQSDKVTIHGPNVYAHRCRFVASNNLKRGDPPTYVRALLINGAADLNYSQRLRQLVDCTFTVDDTVDAEIPAYGIELFNEGQTAEDLLPANAPLVQAYLERPFFMPLRKRDNTDGTGGSHPASYRLLDYAVYAAKGCNVRVSSPRGLVKNGFRWSATSNGGDNFLSLGGDFDLMATVAMFDGDAQAATLCRSYLESNGARLKDAYWGITGTASSMIHRLGGDLILEVESDPTAAGPTQVTDHLLTTKGPQLLHGRLAPSRGIVASSVTFTEAQVSPTLVYSDDGAGNLVDAADGVTVVGEIDYATGWFEISPPATRVDVAVRWKATYQHDNDRAGFLGMLAVLATDAGQRWRCTVASTTAATWEVE